MKTCSKITCASLSLLIAGSSLLYITPASIVKAEPTQMYLVRYKQVCKAIVLPLRKQYGMHYNLDTREYSLKFLRVVKLGYTAGVADVRTKETNGSRFSLSYWQCNENVHCNSSTSIIWKNRLNLDDSIEKWLPGVIQGNGYDGNKLRSGKY